MGFCLIQAHHDGVSEYVWEYEQCWRIPAGRDRPGDGGGVCERLLRALGAGWEKHQRERERISSSDNVDFEWERATITTTAATTTTTTTTTTTADAAADASFGGRRRRFCGSSPTAAPMPSRATIGGDGRPTNAGRQAAAQAAANFMNNVAAMNNAVASHQKETLALLQQQQQQNFHNQARRGSSEDSGSFGTIGGKRR